MIQEILLRISHHIDNLSSTNSSETLTVNHQLDKIEKADPELGKLLRLFKNNYDAHQFIQSDYELRHKVKDIWEMHAKRTKIERDQSWNNLCVYCEKNELILSDIEL